MKNDHINDRKNTRSKYHNKSKIVFSNHELISPEIVDISITGAFVASTKEIATGDKCSFEIDLATESDNPIILIIEAEVARVTKKGFALHFLSMDDETYRHLKNIVLYNSQTPDQIINECKKNPGIK